MKSAKRFSKASGSEKRRALEMALGFGRYAPRLVSRRRQLRRERLNHAT